MSAQPPSAKAIAAAYTPVTIAFHWLAVALIAAGFTLGWTFDDYTGTTKIRLINYHKWIGVTVFLLVVLRSLWRMRHPPPPLPSATPKWQRIASELSHAGLYVLMFAIPLSGWLMSSASGFPVRYLNLVPIPSVLGKNQPLAWMLADVHAFLTDLLLYVVAVHTLAALYHHFVQRDRVLLNMLGVRKPPGSQGA